MASIFTEDHESGTNGVDVATGNSDYTSFSATEPVFTNALKISGSLGMRVTTSTGAARGALYTHGSSMSVVYVRAYVYFDDLPPTGEFLRVKSNTTLRAEVRYNASSGGHFQMRNNTTAVWTSTLSPSADTWYRIEWRVDNTNSQQQCRIFYGANLHGSTPDEDSGNQTYNQGTINRFVFGHEASVANVNTVFDDTAVDDATWVGPLAMGTDHTQGATDSAGLVDALTSEGAFLRSFGDTAVTESGVVVSAGFAREIADDAVTADDASASIELLVSVTDDVEVEDEADDVLTEAGTDWTETIGGEDLGITDGSPTYGLDGDCTDTVNVTDSVTVEKSYLVEDLGITDGSPQVGLAGVTTDLVRITDMVTTAKTVTTSFILTVSDSLEITESEVGTKAFDVYEEEEVFDTEDFQAAFTPAPVTGVEEELGILDEVTVEHGISAGFNWTEDQDDTVNVSDSVLVDHTVVLDIVRTFTDPTTFHDTVDLTFTAAPNSPALTFTDLLIAVDSVVAGVVTIPPGLVRVVIKRSIRGPRCEDWFWRHYPFLPQPAQVALLVYPDGRVLETDDLLSEQARTAPFVAGGGYQTIIESDSWQAQVLSAAGYELEPVT